MDIAQVQQLVTIIGGAVATSAAIGALVFSCLNYFHSRRTLKETRISERRKTVVTRLNEFYGPLLMNLSVIDALYRLLIIGKPKGFRTLTYLLDREQFYETSNGPVKVVLSESDISLLREIIEIEKKTEEHIIGKCGLVEEERLAFNYSPDPSKTDINPEVVRNLGLLSVLLAHFRVLRMAFEGKILAEIDRYRTFVYPRELDNILREQIRKLQTELRSLGGQS
jgi:hypothetical protein